MTAFYEDIDEALAELDDESDDEGLFSRRRKRGRGRRAGYVPYSGGSRPTGNVATAVQRVGNEVANLEEDTGTAIKRIRADFQNFAMMTSLMPLLLTKTATVDTNEATSRSVKVQVQSDNSLTMMLPLLMMSQSGFGGSSSSQGSNNNMMMLMMVLILSERDKDK